MSPDQYTIKEQHLAVGDGHKLYVQEWGNPKAKRTFIFLHGGPGSGINDGYKAFFDPSTQHVIFFDQRGCGQSTPAGKLEANTTQDLVEDINKIADAYKIKTFTLVGGSWGSCLALAYGIAHPKRVEAMVLRGIFTGAQDEIDFIDKGYFSAFFPEVWEEFVQRAPEEFQDNPGAYHSAQALGKDLKAARKSAYAYSEMESSLLRLDDRHTPESIEDFDFYGARIEVHYLANRCFMPDMFIVNNASKLTMPIWIVQGRYDNVCPPMGAYRLHKALPNSQLSWTVAGHSGGERSNYDLTRFTINQLN